MELKSQYQLQTRGSSATFIIDKDTVLIRQDMKLIKYSLKDRKILQETEMNIKYNAFPCAPCGNAFFEVQEYALAIVSLNTFSLDKKPALRFETPLQNASFLQLQQNILILNSSHLYIFDSQQLALHPVVQLPFCDSAALFVYSAKYVGICSFDQLKQYVFDTSIQSVSQKAFPLQCRGGGSLALNQQEILLFGPFYKDFSKKTIYKIDLKNLSHTPAAIVQGEIARSFFDYSADFLYITDESGLVYEFAFTKQQTIVLKNLQIKVQAQKEFKLAQIVSTKDKYDIFGEFMMKECENYQNQLKNVLDLKQLEILHKEGCGKIQELIKAMALNLQKSTFDIKDVLQKQLEESLSEFRKYQQQLGLDIEKKLSEEKQLNLKMRTLLQNSSNAHQIYKMKSQEIAAFKIELEKMKNQQILIIDQEIAKQRFQKMKEVEME